jgi:hypothetical protein
LPKTGNISFHQKTVHAAISQVLISEPSEPKLIHTVPQKGTDKGQKDMLSCSRDLPELIFF